MYQKEITSRIPSPLILLVEASVSQREIASYSACELHGLPCLVRGHEQFPQVGQAQVAILELMHLQIPSIDKRCASLGEVAPGPEHPDIERLDSSSMSGDDHPLFRKRKDTRERVANTTFELCRV